MNSFNLTLSEKHFICPSILDDSFAGYYLLYGLLTEKNLQTLKYMY